MTVIEVASETEKQGTCTVTAVVPACRRVDALMTTLRRIQDCSPRPDEVIVHVDGASEKVVHAIHAFDPTIRVLTSSTLLGPGGSRNRLIAAASHDLVANFDDDAFPQDPGYFQRVVDIAHRFPDAALYSAASHATEWKSSQFQQIAVPSGCGCVFRKSWFQRTGGFVPLPVAYNMEEVDIGLQLHAIGGVIIHDPFLRVVHDRTLSTEVEPEVNARILANTALFPFLRFPVWLWPVGVWSVLHRLVLMCFWGWTAGLVDGLKLIPVHLERYKRYRREVCSPSILTWLLLKRWPKALGEAK